ncbi:hypothetical protein LRAMOSA08861 [Lichtheimia ramosa]|uniref:Very-long-chain (3R)-3-hydroxyacyl-CoA dehydratase n=1 Tax=Lichtheimia ramosa TaxID=688394 RepID=A0A077WH12_9FUNG|nr:hypothetical protein LRAMOSA08861 [Lichtheimia ramosa]
MPASVVYPKSHQGLAAAASAGRRAGPPQFSSANQLILFFYLLGYNNVSFMGWFWVFYTTLYCYLSAGFQYDNVHDLSWQGLTIVQSAALLEVVNSWCGFVRAPKLTTTMQVASRFMLVWGVCYLFPKVQTHWAFVSMVLAWSLAECIRYAYYGTNLIGSVPTGLTWARYNAFLILYPIGVASELTLIYQALPYAKDGNVMYYYFMIATALFYIPGFPILFTHMLSQRRKYFEGSYLVAEKKKYK